MSRPEPDGNLAADFYETCRRVPDRTFLQTEDDREHTYAGVRAEVARVRGILRGHALEPGDRVLLSFANSVELVAAYLAVLSEGCIAILVDPGSPASHVDYVIADAGVGLAVCAPPHPTLGQRPGVSLYEIARAPASVAEGPPPVSRSNTDSALIIYTSGTTGTPKGVCLSHGNLRYTRDAIRTWAAIESGDRELTTLSLNHLFGLAHLHVYWSLGGFVRIHARFGNVPAMLDAISREGITSFPGTPAGFRVLLDQFPDQFAEKAKGLRYIIINSAPLEPDYVQRLMVSVPAARIYMYYGLTEASRSTYICYNDHPTRLASVGRPFPPCEVRLGADREIQVRGPNVALGYWGHPPGEHLTDGWLPTGDVGEMDTDGFLTWRGRLKEQINVDGLKVTPLEVEAVVSTHPQVVEAAAFGIPDPLVGEVVACAVVPRPGSPADLGLAVRRFCRGRLQTYQIPKRVLVVSAIPKTDSGKVKRLALRTMLE